MAKWHLVKPDRVFLLPNFNTNGIEAAIARTVGKEF